ncbi:hypothetical protein BgiBS90_021693, partial [Biomphalaria glabrata]
CFLLYFSVVSCCSSQLFPAVLLSCFLLFFSVVSCCFSQLFPAVLLSCFLLFFSVVSCCSSQLFPAVLLSCFLLFFSVVISFFASPYRDLAFWILEVIKDLKVNSAKIFVGHSTKDKAEE